MFNQTQDGGVKIAATEKYGVYIRSILQMKIALSITEIGRNVTQNLENMIRMKTEGKCIAEGYVKPDTIKI